MKVSLITDAPKHNLALMKISAWHKAQGDEVILNKPLSNADVTYASWLFDFSPRYPADYVGGPGFDPTIRLREELENLKPDYDLFSIDYSLGYTWAYCPRSCGFCCVPKQRNPKKHYSIWTFHDTRFSKICLLNNNTFSDPQWRETFEEIWDAKLTLIEHGFDLRLLDEEKAEALKKTKFEKRIHFAWDRMEDEQRILEGLKIARQFSLNAMVYVLVGYDTTLEEDLYRCQKIHDFGFDPFPMLYKRTPELRMFRRFIYLRYYRAYPNLIAAWRDYESRRRSHRSA